ncbi:TolC family protein [Oscillatoria sp. FACHB-1406]|uniref:TolC family protein n=1 Tax=Oscillatoria sp. FACHB-1406 TaxID=2692846 RepID=UPI001687260B|nr:TolC family protein [Oscillatoria sp. FACHB-1406]MBD2576320.1 TolC family protein [Oscillatoria sp. FACHB-1406]
MNEYDLALLKLRLRRILSSRAGAIAVATLGTFTTVAFAIQGSSPPPRASLSDEANSPEAIAPSDERPSIFDVPAKYRDKLLAIRDPSPLPNSLSSGDRNDKEFGRSNSTIGFNPKPLFPLTGFGSFARSRTSPTGESQPRFNTPSKRQAKFRIPPDNAAQPLPSPASPLQSPQQELPLSLTDAIALALVRDSDSARSYLASRSQPANAEASDRQPVATTLKLGENLALKIPAAAGINYAPGALPGEAESNPQFPSLSQQIITQLLQPLPPDAGDNLAALQTARLTEQSNRLAARQMLEETIAEVGMNYRKLLQAQARVAIEASALDRARSQSLQPSDARWQQAKADLENIRAELSNRLKLDRALPVATVVPNAIEPFPLDESALQQFMLANRPDYLQSQLEVERAKVALQQAETLAVAADNKQGDEKGGSPSEVDLESYRQALAQANHSREVLANRLQLELSDRVRELDLSFKQLQLARKVRQEAQTTPNQGSDGRALEGWYSELVNAQQDELNATIACLNAIARLDLATGNTLNRWGIEVNASSG